MPDSAALLSQLVEALRARDAVELRRLAGSGSGIARAADEATHLLEAHARLQGEIDQLRQEAVRLSVSSQTIAAAEAFTALALQGGNLSLWSLACRDRRMSVDHAWMALVGVTLDPTVDEKTAWEAAVEPVDHRTLMTQLDQHLAGKSDGVECTFRLRRDSGDPLWLMARGQIVERDADGQPTLLAGTMLDVTRWKTLEDQLRQAQKLESIGQLAAGIAHEINTPIQFIGDNTRFAAGSLEAIFTLIDRYRTALAGHPDAAALAAAEAEADLDYLRDELPKSLSQTGEGIDRVATIVHAMKEFSHPGGGEKAATDINRAIRNTITISRNEWKFVAACHEQLDPELPPVPLLAGDFNQVLLNLIVNAAHAIGEAQRGGRPGPGRITIVSAREDTCIRIDVSDDGCGIPEAIRERIYDPFFTTKEVGRGSGQGLAIARSVVVDKHGGTLTCASTVGKGTTFTIRLPLEERHG